MSCSYSREVLALYIEDDLSPAQTEQVGRHVSACPECRLSCEQLQKSQSLIKSRLKPIQASISPERLAGVRRIVLSQIEVAQSNLGWAVKLERWIMFTFRSHRYATAGLFIMAIVSASLLAEMRSSRPESAEPDAVFVGKDTLVRPAGYREWVFVGSSMGLNYAENAGGKDSGLFHNVYMNPSAYREYVRSGRFPEGTVMVLELARSELKSEPGLQGSFQKEFVALEASVKDSSRFEGGWGYFSFTDAQGQLKASAAPEGRGCRSCHQARAETDHVFTQFYPVLRLARS